MELEKLEVKLDIDLSGIEQSISKVLPQINGLLKKVESATGQSGNKIEQNLDMSDATKKVENILGDFIKKFSQQMDRMEEISKSKADATSRNLEQGFKQTRVKANKEIDLMVKDINAKTSGARAAQNKIAHLTAQRASAVKYGDNGAVVKYDEQIASAEQRMMSYRNKASEMARAMKKEFDAVPSSLKNIAATMEQNESQIETMRAKIANMQRLYESQRKITGSFQSGFSTTDSDKSLDTMQKIQKQTAQMNKLISSNDALQKAYADTEDRVRSLRQALGLLDNGLAKSSIQTGNTALGIQNIAAKSDKAGSVWSRLGGLFNRTSNFIAHGARRSSSLMGGFFSLFSKGSNNITKRTNGMTRSTGLFGSAISRLATRILIYGLLYRGILALSKGMLSALKTNDQFASSLNQIQVNLLTAFYPIYQAVLPAINALMSALARATGYIASFIAGIFGSTYEAAKQGASGLYDNVKALEETGSGATEAKEKIKELQRALMGFDEINRIGLDVNSDSETGAGSGSGAGAPGVNFDTPDYSTPAWLSKFADNARSILSQLFEPVQAAWNKHGKTVTDAFKYSLSEIWGLSQSIGSSFMDVWTNGTGEVFIGNILLLLSNVLYLIGDIAKAFKDAWNDEGRGTALIQSVFDMWNSVLGLLYKVTDTFRDVWNDGTGERIAGNILEIYTNLNKAISDMVDNFGEAWDEAGNGERIFKNILGFAEDITEKAKEITEATREWAGNLDFGPLLDSIAGMTGNLRSALQPILDGLGGLYENVLLPISKWAIEEGVPAAFDAISEAFRLLGNVLEAVKPVLAWLWENFLVPLGEWVGATLVGELESITSTLGFLADAVENPKKAFGELKDIVVEKAREMSEKTKNFFGDIRANASDVWNTVSSKVSTKANEAKTNAINAFSNMKSKVGEYLSVIQSTASTTFDKVTGWASGLGSKIAEGLRNGLGAIKSAANSIANGIVGVIGGAVNGVIGGVNWVLDKVGAGGSKLSTWEVPYFYAKGTNAHPGGLAMVNDGSGKNYREAFQLPGGQVGLFPNQRNMLVNLPRGAKVLDGERTNSMYGGVPRYANGIGDWFSKAYNGAKEMAGTVWDYLSNPSELLDIAISKFVNLSDAVNPALAIAKGGISTVAGSATNFIKGMLEKGSESPVGTGVERWRPTVIRALSMNGLPTTDAYVNAWLRQIQSESGGNEKAIQGNIGDINNKTGDLAKGLVQVIGATFNAYKFPGHDNRLNGLDSLLAGINYAKSRYGATGMLGVIGHGHGYENGGVVSKEGYYRLAEGNKKEMVIPLEKRNRAIELLEIAKDYLGVSDTSSLQMPDLFLETPMQRLDMPISTREAGGGLTGMSESISNAIAMYAASGNKASGPMEVTLVMDGQKIGKIVINEINEIIDRTGAIPINI